MVDGDQLIAGRNPAFEGGHFESFEGGQARVEGPLSDQVEACSPESSLVACHQLQSSPQARPG